MMSGVYLIKTRLSKSCLDIQTFVCYTFAMDVQKVQHQKVVRYLKRLGLEDEEPDIYVYLLSHGPQTVLQISRGISTGRTKLYPILERLADKQLITIHERHYGTTYEAQPPEVLEFIVNQHEQSAAQLRSSLPAATHLLNHLMATPPTASRIVEYRGIDGLKQMNYNLTKAKKEFRVIELAGLDKHLGKYYANKMRQRVKERGLTTYDLTNNPERISEPGIESANNHVKYISPGIFSIEFETYIYDDCVGLLSYSNDDIFGIEIYNQKLARQQRQLFDLLWNWE